jgi:hypothetical protein
MKRIVLVSVLVVAILALMTSPALAAKPNSNPVKPKQTNVNQSAALKEKPNQAGAEKVPWNLSGAVMPVPPFGPYGTADIPGSDTASKLIVNRPNGNTWLTLTGIMRGLAPRTTYTVYISNGYAPYVQTGWDVTGSYTIDLTFEGAHIPEYLVLTQTGAGITGTYLALDAAGTVSPWNIDSGTVTGDQLTFTAHFQDDLTMTATFSATIAPDGTLVSGTWADVAPGTRSGEWASTSGNAMMTHTGDITWPGLFSAGVQPFTFTTTPSGNATWHKNLKMAVFPGPGTYKISAWVNGPAGSILISDTFTVTR